MCCYGTNIIILCCIIGIFYLNRVFNAISRYMREEKLREQIIIELKARGVEIKDL